MNVLIISGSIRESASTRRVGLHLLNKLQAINLLRPELIDLTDYEYPIWKEVFHREDNPPVACRELHAKLESADAMIFITPEYNGSYSLALKNMIDYFGLNVFEKKVIGITAVSTGALGGIRAALSLQHLSLAIFAVPVAQMLLVPHVHLKFDEEGSLMDVLFEKNITRFISEFLWLSEAVSNKRQPITLPG